MADHDVGTGHGLLSPALARSKGGSPRRGCAADRTPVGPQIVIALAGGPSQGPSKDILGYGDVGDGCGAGGSGALPIGAERVGESAQQRCRDDTTASSRLSMRPVIAARHVCLLVFVSVCLCVRSRWP